MDWRTTALHHSSMSLSFLFWTSQTGQGTPRKVCTCCNWKVMDWHLNITMQGLGALGAVFAPFPFKEEIPSGHHDFLLWYCPFPHHHHSCLLLYMALHWFISWGLPSNSAFLWYCHVLNKAEFQYINFPLGTFVTVMQICHLSIPNLFHNLFWLVFICFTCCIGTKKGPPNNKKS